MLKFYYSGAPNPTKVALFLEEAGLPYEAIPVDTRKGDQHKPEYLGDQSERQGAGDRRRRRDGVRFQRDPALSRREDRQVPAAATRQGARRIAVLADVRRLRRRALFRASRCISAITRRRRIPTRSTATSSRRSAISASSMRGSASSKYMRRRHLHDRRHGRLGLGAADAERARRGTSGRNSRT